MRKQHAVLWFYVLTFLISWLGMVPLTLHAQGRSPLQSPLLSVFGGLGPTIAAVVVALLVKGKPGLRELFGPLLLARVGMPWYLVAFLGMPFLAAMALGLLILLDAARPDWAAFGPWFGAFPIFLLNLLSNVWEEIGWRGFALPLLQARYSALLSSLVLGILWAAWHAPLLLDPSHPMSTLPWYAFLINVVAISVIYTWLYNNTRGSLLLVTLFHAVSNTVAFVLNAALTEDAFVLHYQLLSGVIVLAAALLTVVYGAGALSRRAEPPHAVSG